jgi:hypothetical protein
MPKIWHFFGICQIFARKWLGMSHIRKYENGIRLKINEV